MLDSLVRVSRRVACAHYASVRANAGLAPGGPHAARGCNTPRGGPRAPGLCPAARRDAGPPRPSALPYGALSGRGASGRKSFPFNNFTCCLTLFPKCFSSFDHSTCALSVSGRYLALEDMYLPLKAAFPNNSTRRRRFAGRRPPARDRALTFCGVPFQGTRRGARRRSILSKLQLEPRHGARFQIWAGAASLAVTGAIPVGFLSSAY